MRIYVASSWRNLYQQTLVEVLRHAGHKVYDFKHEGFSWSDVDPEWQKWPEDVAKYLDGLNHPAAIRGFDRDMNALKWCDACIMVMPCGPSASMEMGWAVGAGKDVAIWTPGIREPDLMVKMADLITRDIDMLLKWAAEKSLKYVADDEMDY